jgi:outer membrane protein TolC
MNNIYKSILFISFSLLLSRGRFSVCQEKQNEPKLNTSDSLSLVSIIEEIVKAHPTVRGAEEALRNADARIGLARTGYYPVVDASASFANIGPVLKFTIPEIGTVQLYPANNYTGAINYRQVIYDFGRTSQSINIEEQNKTLGEMTVEQVKQRMSLVAVNSFYTLAYLQEAVKIKDEQLTTLDEHLRYVRKMKETGSATDYQILTTEVRISTAESQKVDILSSLNVQQAYLSSLLGMDDLKAVVREELEVTLPSVNKDSVQAFALRNRNEMLISKERTSLAGLRYDLIKTVNRPIISLSISGGAKNGYIPELGQLRANYSAGVGISVPIFDGMKSKYNLLQAKSAINSAEFEVENTKRNITSEVREAESYLESAHQKVSQFSLQLDQALQAYSLAETSFRSGVITNLELLDANTAVSESRLMLLKAKIDYAASIYRLKAALGERLY